MDAEIRVGTQSGIQTGISGGTVGVAVMVAVGKGWKGVTVSSAIIIAVTFAFC